MVVEIRIQHAAGRDAPLNRLLALLPRAVEVITDKGAESNPWRGYQRCLSGLPAEGHVAILQDDTLVGRHFLPALELIAAANPEVPVCLFSGGLPRRTAMRIREALMTKAAYVDLAGGEFMPVVAVLWPVQIAEAFLTWAAENPRRLPRAPARSDDAIAGRWLRFTHQRVRVTVPSLVQHPDDSASTIGKPARFGADKGRVAVHWIGDGDPLLINWS